MMRGPASSSGAAGAPAPQTRALMEAMQLLQRGDWTTALARVTALVSEAPNSADAQQLFAMCLAEAGRASEAEAAFERALDLGRGHPLILLNYGAFLRRMGRYDAALVPLQRATVQAPKHANAWRELGSTALALGRNQQAIAALEQACKLDPDAVATWHTLGRACLSAGDLARAQDALSEALKRKPESAPILASLGAVKRKLGQVEQAMTAYQQARAAGLDTPELEDAQIGLLVDQGLVRQALTRARALVTEHPEFASGYTTLAHLLWEYGAALEPECDPLQELAARIAGAVQLPRVRLAYARILLSAQRAEAALTHIRALRALADQPVFAALEADTLAQLGDTAAADRLYASVVEQVREPALLNSYARHLLRLGRWQEAAERAQQATSLDPDNQQAWAYLGTAWRLLGDPREAWLCDYQQLVTQVSIAIPEGYQSLSEFLVQLRAALLPMHHARSAPLEQSVRGGSQTPGVLLGATNAAIGALRAALQASTRSWLGSLRSDAKHPFLRRLSADAQFVGSWSVLLQRAGKHSNHVHQEGWISSAFYVDLPPSVVESHEPDFAGCLQFGQPPVELGLDLSPRHMVRPKLGTLALFPSYFWHGTVPFEDTHPRLTVAFDAQPKRARI